MQYYYLRLPCPRLTWPYTVLPLPNKIDAWIQHNYYDSLTNVLLPGYLDISDVPMDQVMCTILLNVTVVSYS